MKTNLIQHLGLALTGVALALSGGPASAQTVTNIVYTYDTAIPTWNGWYNQIPTFSWSSYDAATNPASGSLGVYIPYGMDGNGNNSQCVFFSGFNPDGSANPVNLDNYATESFDILVDTNSTPNNAGNFGTLQVYLFNSYNTTKLGEWLVPGNATNQWYHVSMAIPAGIGTWTGPAFWFQNWDGSTYPNQPNGPCTYYIDNLTFTAKAPSPGINLQPVSQQLYPGAPANWNVSVSGGQPLSFQWFKGTAALTDGTNVSGSVYTGSLSNVFSVMNVSAADVGAYHLVITNAFGSITSSVANLTITHPTGAEAVTTVALSPVAFYQLNETNNPATGSPAYDPVGGFAGVYAATASNAFDGITGPSGVFFPGFPGHEGAVSLAAGSGQYVKLPALNLNTNTVTMTAWIFPTAVASDAGIVFSRYASTTAGLCYNDDGESLGYNWNNSQSTWGWQTSGLFPPTNQWSFAALVTTANDATVYLFNAAGEGYGNNGVSNPNQLFEGTTYIGLDSAGNTRTFAGSISDVAIFNYSLTTDQLLSLYFAGAGGPTLRFNGQNLSWDDLSQTSPYPSTTTVSLQQATSLKGPWTGVTGATSPWPVTTTGAAGFYRLVVQ